MEPLKWFLRGARTVNLLDHRSLGWSFKIRPQRLSTVSRPSPCSQAIGSGGGQHWLYLAAPVSKVNVVTALASELDRTLQELDAATASRLERLVRDAIELVRPVSLAEETAREREQWLSRLDQLRSSVGTGKPGLSTEEILDNLRAEDGA